MSLTFDEYQKLAATTAIYPQRVVIVPNDWVHGQPLPEPVDNVFYAALGGAGEFGEIANKVKKIMRDANGVITGDVRAAVEKEIGDGLWYLSELARKFGATLGECAQENLDKLFSRQERGVLSGSGDNR